VRAWALLLGGLLVWAAHFFLLYGIASVFPGQALAEILSLVATIPAVAADAALLWLALVRKPERFADEFGRWQLGLAAAGALLSLVAVIWQTLPAVIL
jgi:hypothetical protein